MEGFWDRSGGATQWGIRGWGALPLPRTLASHTARQGTPASDTLSFHCTPSPPHSRAFNPSALGEVGAVSPHFCRTMLGRENTV